MRNLRLPVGLAATAIVIGASVAYGALSDNFTNPAAPVPGGAQPIFLKMTGITGGVTTAGNVGAIRVLGLDLGLTTPVSPTSGQASGKAACRGVEFRKATDRATPQLFDAEARNQVISKATFQELGPSSRVGGVQAVNLTVTLTNVIVSSIHHLDATTTGAYEDVSLVPQKVELQWLGTGTNLFSYSCNGGKPAP